MTQEMQLTAIYQKADASGRVEIILKLYNRFPDVIRGLEDGLRYLIINEKKQKRRREMGELGVRVRGSGYSDPTQQAAVENVVTTDAIRSLDFGSILEGTDLPEEHYREARTLHDMREDYDLITSQIGMLEPDYRRDLECFLTKKKDIQTIADDDKVAYESARKRIYRAKKRVKEISVYYLEKKYSYQ